ncbi:aminotransferase class I/II-fold pyridoxal phosphate-dependent enzyme [Amycolatopsis minnesotensis]|uniref:PLP-dependent aminotransferase family protein n=1 Tax=Amycolatopsis minnesotensis TaxID=337894 RepID=A0ABP5EFM3_9PSEU
MPFSEGESAGPLSHDDNWSPGVVQAVSPVGVTDLGPGYLEPALLPVDLLNTGYARAMERFGAAALSYGDNQGALELRTVLASRVAITDGRNCGPEQVLLTAGTSHALHLIATMLCEPGAVVFTDATCYDFGRQLLADSGLRVRAVAGDECGMLPDALGEAVRAERAAGNRVGFVYLIPTFHNPTGLVVPEARRRELLAVTTRHDVLVVEDDAYAELGYDDPCPASLAAIADYHGVIRLRTFSKTLAPGLRLGWLLAGKPVTDRLVRHGLFVSGGSANHVSSLAVLTMLRTGDYDKHLDWLRDRLRLRRNALLDGLESLPGDEFHFTRPPGGFFVWLRALHGRTEAGLLEAAGKAAVAVAAGSRFGRTADPAVRLAFSFNSPERLRAAADQFAGALVTTHQKDWT